MDYFKQLQDNYPMFAENLDSLTSYTHDKFVAYANKHPEIEFPKGIIYIDDEEEIDLFYVTILLHCAEEFSKVIKEIGFKHKLCIGEDDESPGRVFHAVIYVEDDKSNRKLIELMKLQDEIIEHSSADNKIKELLIENQQKLQSLTKLREEEIKFNKLIDLVVEYSNNSVLFDKIGLDFEKMSGRLVEHELDCDDYTKCDYCYCSKGLPCSDICCVSNRYKKPLTVNSLFHKYVYHNWTCDIDPIVEFINMCNGF